MDLNIVEKAFLIVLLIPLLNLFIESLMNAVRNRMAKSWQERKIMKPSED